MPQLGIALPTVYMGEGITPEYLASYAQEAERLGFHSAWLLDRLLHPDHPVLEPISIMAYIAGKTSKLKLGTSILLFPLRNPYALAKALATIDFLSQGRVIAGLALGGERHEYEAFRLSWERRVRRFNEGIRLLKAQWSGEALEYEGEIGKVKDLRQLPTPVQKPHPPIWLGGNSEGVLRRAARYADGWICGGGLTLKDFKERRGRLVELLEGKGRDPKAFTFAKHLYIHVAEDREEAKGLMKRELEGYLRRPYEVEGRCAYGTPEDCAGFLREFAEAGANLIILVPVRPELEQPRRIAQEVAPRL